MSLLQRSRGFFCAAAAGLACLAAQAQEGPPGAELEPLLALARAGNPEYASMRYEAQAAAERIVPAGALPDPRFSTEWMDITRMGEQSPTLSPSRVGSTRYFLMQDLPWFGKRALRRDIAALEAEGADGQAMGSWAELATKIKTIHAQRYYLQRNAALSREILDLLVRLEQMAQQRYVSGLAAQQDVIRAQVEQTGLRTELVALENEERQLNARLNALLARPATASLAPPQGWRPWPLSAQLEYATLAERVRSRNPQLFSEARRLQAAEKSRELTYKNRYPDFSVTLSPTQKQSSVKEWGLMVGLNIPLQQASRRAQEREAEAMLAAARARQEAASNRVLSELAESVAAIEAAQRTEQLASSHLLPQTELTFSAALAGYETGKVDFATLIDAQKQIRQARQNQLKAQVDAQMRLAEIEKLVGEQL